MAAKNVGKMTVEWAALQSKLPAGSRTGLASVRSQFQALQKKLNEVPEEPAPIDFASYKAKIASPGFVDLVAADYKEAAAKITYPEDTKSAQIAADQAKATAAVDALIQESNAKLSSLKVCRHPFYIYACPPSFCGGEG